MLKRIHEFEDIYIAGGATDGRKSVDGLASIISQGYRLDPFSNSLFLFCNKAKNRMKALVWDKTGFVLYYKRLDGKGAKFHWPQEEEDMLKINVDQLKLLLTGFNMEGFKEVTARDFY